MRISAPRSEGVGIEWPEREADCTGQRPAWVPFQVETEACENDGPDPIPLTAREMSIGEAKPIPWWPFS